MSESNSTTREQFALTSPPLSQEEERKAKTAIYQAAWREANKEHIKAYRDATKDKSKAYYKAHKEKLLALGKAHYKANKARMNLQSKTNHLRRRYGLTPDECNQMLQGCDGRCPLCKTPFTELWNEQPQIDHCHKTGVVRGILCRACNQGLGLFKDNPKLLRAGARYLERALK
jgi:Recombination endonuclease VII